MRPIYYRKRKRKIIRGILILICSLFLILILAYIFLFSSIFRIKEIQISGNKDTKTEEIKNNLNYKNIFLATGSKIKNDLLKKFPQISELEVEKNLIKREIKIIIKEREEFGIVCQENTKNCFYIDKLGFIFKEAPQTSGSLVILIKDYSSRDYKIGEKIFEENITNFIGETREFLISEINLQVLEFDNLSFPPDDLKVITNESWYILFNLQKQAQDQLSALKAVLEEKIKEARKDLEYVDLRIENRVYYK
ncbi:MAG: cell division protein FtsQ/DivIB [Patescibacteria group bacterium]